MSRPRRVVGGSQLAPPFLPVPLPSIAGRQPSRKADQDRRHATGSLRRCAAIAADSSSATQGPRGVPRPERPPAGWLAAVDAVSRRGPAFWRVGSSFLWDPTKLIRKRDELLKLFRGLDTAQCPFANLPEKKSGRWGAGLTAAKMDGCRWLRPELVGQFEYVEWTPRATSDTRVSSG